MALVGTEMTTLLVRFDSAWTAHNSGALASVLRRDDGTFHDLGPPVVVNYAQAERVVKDSLGSAFDGRPKVPLKPRTGRGVESISP